ncbi:MAG TPA: glycosyltransferase family 39 protein [Lacunisphaera sp.]|nr:glycosyltransferase family 39 protein [Lacunisphaera sp.]
MRITRPPAAAEVSVPEEELRLRAGDKRRFTPASYMLEPDSAPTCRRDLAVLALVFGLLYFFQLGDSPLVNPDESRYAEIPREMIARGDYVLPRLDGVFYFEKPPLVYWVLAGFQKVFGRDDFAMRAVSALFALGGVLLTYGAACRLHGRLAAVASATVLGTSLLYFALGRILTLDMAVSVLMAATLFCFILAVREPPGRTRRCLFYGLYAAAALATLTKGLIGFLVTGAVMFLWLLVFNQWRRLRPFYLPTGALLFLAIAAPWHVLAALRNAEWARFYFIHEHWQRFTTTEGHDRYQPWWFFLPVIAGGIFPWMGFLWPALRDSVAGGWARRKENADAWFFVTWVGFVLVFFSKSHSKLVPYILPVFPALAVVIGAWIARVIATDDRPRIKVGMWMFSAMSLLLGLGIAWAVLKPGLIRRPEQMAALRDNGLYCAFALAAGGGLVHWLWRRKHALATVGTMAATILVLLLTLADAQDKIAKPGTYQLAEYYVRHARPGDQVFHYAEYFHDFSYYAQTEVGLVGNPGELELAIDPAARASGRFIDEAAFRRVWSGAARVWLVIRPEEAVKLYADPTFRYYLLEESRSHYLLSNQH